MARISVADDAIHGHASDHTLSELSLLIDAHFILTQRTLRRVYFNVIVIRIHGNSLQPGTRHSFAGGGIFIIGAHDTDSSHRVLNGLLKALHEAYRAEVHHALAFDYPDGLASVFPHGVI